MIWPTKASVRSAYRNERIAYLTSLILAAPSLSDLQGSDFSAFWTGERLDPTQTTALWPLVSESRDHMMQHDSVG